MVNAYKHKSKFNKVRQPISKWISHNSGVMVPYKNIVNTIKSIVKNFEPDIVVIDYIGMYNYYVSFSIIKEMMGNGVWNSLNTLGNTLNSGLDLIIANLMLSGVATGQISVAKTIESMFTILWFP